jgi:transposase
MGQPSLLAADLEEFIPEKHLVRVINKTINGLELNFLMEQYKGGGTSSYHPKMMLKVLMYAYTQGRTL